MLSKQKIIQHHDLTSMLAPYGERIKHPISFVFLASSLIPMGKIHNYAHYRLLYDGMSVLAKRVSKDQIQEFLKKDLSNTILEIINRFDPSHEASTANEILRKIGEQTGPDLPINIRLSSFDNSQDIQERYDILYKKKEDIELHLGRIPLTK